MKNDFLFFAISSLDKPSISTASNSYLLKQRSKERGKNANLTIPDGVPDIVHIAQNAAIQDLLTVIAHVRKLFAGEFAKEKGLIARLNELESAVHVVELGIYKHGFPSGRHYEEYEELCSLESELDGFSDFDFGDDSPEKKLLTSLIAFWLDEIRCRGYDLFNLLIGSLGHEEITASFSALGKIRFPRKNDNKV